MSYGCEHENVFSLVYMYIWMFSVQFKKEKLPFKVIFTSHEAQLHFSVHFSPYTFRAYTYEVHHQWVWATDRKITIVSSSEVIRIQDRTDTTSLTKCPSCSDFTYTWTAATKDPITAPYVRGLAGQTGFWLQSVLRAFTTCISVRFSSCGSWSHFNVRRKWGLKSTRRCENETAGMWL